MSIIDPIALFKSLSDQTRLRCLSLLVQEGELCVCELTVALDLPQPKISHHLANLRKSGLVSDRKMGLWIYYKIHPQLPQWVIELLQTTITGISHNEPFSNDRKKLKAMPKAMDNFCSS